MTATDNGEVKLADFDLDEWIDGTTGIVGVARVVQRGDLLATRDRLDAELAVAKQVPQADRGVGDRTPQQIDGELEQVYQQIWTSMLWVHVQDRTQPRRDQIRDRLKKQGVDTDDIVLHLLADSIVKVETSDGRVVPIPEEGFPPAKLRAIRDRAGDAALIDLKRVYGEVTAQAPAVRAPLSRSSSSTAGGTTSQ